MIWHFLKKRFDLSSVNQAKRMIANTFMFSGIIYVYSTVRIAKDSLAYNASKELPGIVKTWLVLPAAIIVGLVFEALYKRFKSKTVFYGTAAVFTSYFVLYAYVIGPYSGNITLVGDLFAVMCKLLNSISSFITFDNVKLGSILDAVLGKLARNFSVSVFYAMAELFGNIFIGMLFWGFMNSTTDVEDASTTFLFYNIASAVSSVLSGLSGLADSWSSISTKAVVETLAAKGGSNIDWDTQIKSSVMKIVLAMILVVVSYYLSRRNAEKDPKVSFESEKKFLGKKKKKKGSIFESITYIRQNRYIRYLTIMIICYSSLMFCLEYMAKGLSMHLLGGNKGIFRAVQSIGMIVQGVLMMLSLALAIKLTKNTKWRKMIWITPITIAVTSALMFLAATGVIPSSLYTWLKLDYLLSNNLWNIEIVNPIAGGQYLAGIFLIVSIMQGILCKMAKYVILDISKERAFLLTSYKERTTGKNMMESLSSRFGKGFTSLVFTSFLVPVFLSTSKEVFPAQPAIIAWCIFTLIFFFYACYKIIPIYEERESLFKKNNSADIFDDMENSSSAEEIDEEVDEEVDEEL